MRASPPFLRLWGWGRAGCRRGAPRGWIRSGPCAMTKKNQELFGKIRRSRRQRGRPPLISGFAGDKTMGFRQAVTEALLILIPIVILSLINRFTGREAT